MLIRIFSGDFPRSRLLTALLILIFTRETIGRMYAHDWALVSRESCLRGR